MDQSAFGCHKQSSVWVNHYRVGSLDCIRCVWFYTASKEWTVLLQRKAYRHVKNLFSEAWSWFIGCKFIHISTCQRTRMNQHVWTILSCHLGAWDRHPPANAIIEVFLVCANSKLNEDRESWSMLPTVWLSFRFVMCYYNSNFRAWCDYRPLTLWGTFSVSDFRARICLGFLRGYF